MSASESLATPLNRLLAALPTEDYQRLVPHLELVTLSVEQVISGFGQLPEYVYFPNQSVVSVVSLMANGTMTEVGLIGQEGMVGIQVILGGSATPYQMFVQVADSAMRMPAACLKAEFDRGGALQTLLLRYVQGFLTQVSQTAACNRLHMLEERFARWLLLVADCVKSNDLALTQEFAAQMLGVRRPGVTEAASALQRSGLIRYKRGKVTILNRDGLEETACECYRLVKDEFDRLLNGPLS